MPYPASVRMDSTKPDPVTGFATAYYESGRSPRMILPGPLTPDDLTGAVRPARSWRGRPPRTLLAGPSAPHALSGVRPGSTYRGRSPRKYLPGLGVSGGKGGERERPAPLPPEMERTPSDLAV